MYVLFVEHVRYIVMYIFRLIREITRREYERLHGRDVEAPQVMEEELKTGKLSTPGGWPSSPGIYSWQEE